MIEGAPCSLDVALDKAVLTYNIKGTSQPVEIEEIQPLIKEDVNSL
jgi:hypothetical protein